MRWKDDHKQFLRKYLESGHSCQFKTITSILSRQDEEIHEVLPEYPYPDRDSNISPREHKFTSVDIKNLLRKSEVLFKRCC